MMNKDKIKKSLAVCVGASCDGCAYVGIHDCCDKVKRDARACIIKQEKEIEKLKDELKQLKTNSKILARGVRDLNHENYELTEKVKQAQTDTINAIVKYCETPSHWNELKDCKLWGGKSDDLRDFLNGIFK